MFALLHRISYQIIFAGLLVVAIGSTVWLFVDGRGELVPQLWVSVLTLALSYLAAAYTVEKFRLDLLDRRFEIYRKTLEFCSIILQEGDLAVNDRNREAIQQAIAAAHESFRGIGFHKSKALFGDDINDVFKELSDCYSHIQAFGGNRQGDQRAIEEFWRKVTYVVDMSSKLPDLFKPYLYFGDYKRG